jgi:hypothetical protein
VEYDSEDDSAKVIDCREEDDFTDDVRNLFAKIEIRFRQLDNDDHGFLQRDEIQSLTNWVLKNWRPRGEGVNTEELMKVREGLLKECAQCGDALTCPVFIEWLERTCENIERVRKVVAWRNRSTQLNVPVLRVIDVQVTEVELGTSGNFRSSQNFSQSLSQKRSQKMSPAAEAALQRYNEGWFWRCCHY